MLTLIQSFLESQGSDLLKNLLTKPYLKCGVHTLNIQLWYE